MSYVSFKTSNIEWCIKPTIIILTAWPSFWFYFCAEIQSASTTIMSQSTKIMSQYVLWTSSDVVVYGLFLISISQVTVLNFPRLCRFKQYVYTDFDTKDFSLIILYSILLIGSDSKLFQLISLHITTGNTQVNNWKIQKSLDKRKEM